VSDSLVRKLRSQIGDDVQEIYSHEALFRLAADQIEALEAQLAQRDAALKAADGLAVMLENCLEVLTKKDERICCDGRECGCYGATKHQEAEHYATEALSAYRKARGQDA
jgi:23S rRNA maturation mini-RNase III